MIALYFLLVTLYVIFPCHIFLRCWKESTYFMPVKKSKIVHTSSLREPLTDLCNTISSQLNSNHNPALPRSTRINLTLEKTQLYFWCFGKANYFSHVWTVCQPQKRVEETISLGPFGDWIRLLFFADTVKHGEGWLPRTSRKICSLGTQHMQLGHVRHYLLFYSSLTGHKSKV